MAAVALMLVMLLQAFAIEQAHAACPAITVFNNTGCAVKISLHCPGGAVVGPIIVPAGGVGVLNPPAGCVPVVRTSVCGVSTAVPAGGCIFNAHVAPNCCADVCYDPVTCTVTFTPVPGPCPCN